MAKYTVRINERDDAGLMDYLKRKSASRAFRDALRSQIRKNGELEALVRREAWSACWISSGSRRSSNRAPPARKGAPTP